MMKKKLINLVLLFMLLVIPFSVVKAEDNYFNAGENVNSNGEYHHSLFVAGNNIKNHSLVHGISFVAGNSIDLSGSSEYSFVAGESIDINSIIEKDLFAAGNNIKIGKDASLQRDAYIAGNNIKVLSNINGTAFIAGSIIELDNVTINGDIKLACNTLNIVGNVTVNGKLTINEEALINNENNIKANSIEKYKDTVNVDIKTKLSDYVIDILSLIFTGIILVLIFSKVFKELDYDLKPGDIGKKLLSGLGVLILMPMLAILSFAVVVGISVGVIIIMLYVISLMLATIMSSIVIGHNIYTKVFKQKENVYVSVIIGIILIKLIELVPVIGPILGLFVFLYGLGIIWDIFKKRNK